MDFSHRDWTFWDEGDPIKSLEVARFKYNRHLASYCYGFNRAHFIVAANPLRVVSLPYSLNGKRGLICIPVGDRKSLEKLDIESLLARASPIQRGTGIMTALDLFNAHPEPFESAEAING